MLEIGQCEFCGNERLLSEATPFHGFYCEDCLKMNIEYDKEQIKLMKPKGKKNIDV